MKIDLSKKIIEYAKKILVITLIIHICILSIGSSGVRADDVVDVDEEIEKLGEMPPDKGRMEEYLKDFKEYYKNGNGQKPNIDQALQGNFNADPSLGTLEKALAYIVYLYGKTGSNQLNPYRANNNDFEKWITISGAMSKAIDEGTNTVVIDGVTYKIDEVKSWDDILSSVEDAKEREYPEEEPEVEESGDFWAGVLDGIAGVLFIGFKIIPIIIGGALELIMNVSSGEKITIYNLLFNEVGLTDINFFNKASRK